MRSNYHRLMVLICFAATVALAAASEAPDPGAHRLARVDSLIESGRPEAALPLLVEMVERNDLPDELNWPVYQRLGLVFEAMGRDEQALDFLEKAAIWGPHVAVNHRNLGSLLMKMGRTGRAMSEIREAAELEPDDFEIRLEYSQALEAMGQIGRARRELEAAAEIRPDALQVRRAQARFYMNRQDYRSAEPHLAFLLDADPDPEIRKQLSLARLRLDRPEAARLLLLPDWPDGLDQQEIRIVLEADLALGDGERAASLISLSPDFTTSVDDPDLWALASLVCLQTDRNAVALQMIDLAIALSPGIAGYHNNRYVLLKRLGRDREASREWDLLLDLDPSRAEARDRTGEQSP